MKNYTDPGEPNETIVLHGLSYQTDETAIRNALIDSNAAFTQMRLVRERSTNKSRGFAFVTFFSLEHAIEWVSNNIPVVMIDGVESRIEYAKPVLDDDWECSLREICYRCKSPKGAEIQKQIVNDGGQDVGSTPSHLLLLRGLDPETTVEMVHKTMSDLAPVKSVMLVKDRNSHAKKSWGFAFVDCDTIEVANQILNVIFNQRNPKPLYIDDKPIYIAYGHLGSFIPMNAADSYISFARNDNGKQIFYSYWDQGASCVPFPNELIIEKAAETISSKEKVEEKENPKKKVKKKTLDGKFSLQVLRWVEKQKELDAGDINEYTEEELLLKLPDDHIVNEEYTDFNRIACLLCQRKFQDFSQLDQHFRLSKLHCKSMTILRLKQIEDLRQMLIQQNQLVEYPEEKETERPTLDGIKEDNKGNRLLQKMGWKEGEGLGPSKMGILNPVKPQIIPKGVGIGSVKMKIGKAKLSKKNILS